jgi:hypothetical protein
MINGPKEANGAMNVPSEIVLPAFNKQGFKETVLTSTHTEGDRTLSQGGVRNQSSSLFRYRSWAIVLSVVASPSLSPSVVHEKSKQMRDFSNCRQ